MGGGCYLHTRLYILLPVGGVTSNDDGGVLPGFLKGTPPQKKKYQKYKDTYPKNTYNVKNIPKTILKMPKSISKNTFHHVFILIQPGNQAVFTPLQAGLNSDLKKYHSFFFMTVANTNHWQMIPQNNTYDPNKYHIYRE